MSFTSEAEIKKEVERQFDILKRGCDEIINESEFKKKHLMSQILKLFQLSQRYCMSQM